jgi:hypothetical protein
MPSIREIEEQRQRDDQQKHAAQLGNHTIKGGFEVNVVGCSKRPSNAAAGEKQPEAYQVISPAHP